MKSPRNLIAFIMGLRRQKFDWAIDFEHWPRLSALITFWERCIKKNRLSIGGSASTLPFLGCRPTCAGAARGDEFSEDSRIIGVSYEGDGSGSVGEADGSGMGNRILW